MTKTERKRAEPRKTARIYARATEAQKAKYERLGGNEWLCRVIDRAKEPIRAASPDQMPKD